MIDTEKNSLGKTLQAKLGGDLRFEQNLAGVGYSTKVNFSFPYLDEEKINQEIINFYQGEGFEQAKVPGLVFIDNAKNKKIIIRADYDKILDSDYIPSWYQSIMEERHKCLESQVSLLVNMFSAVANMDSKYLKTEAPQQETPKIKQDKPAFKIQGLSIAEYVYPLSPQK